MGSLTIQQKVIIAVIAVVVLYGALALTCVVPGLKLCDPAVKSVKLEMWGVFDTSNTWRGLFRVYRSQGSGATIEYRKIPFDDYEQELINAFAIGEGPDIFFIHNTWLPKFLDKLTPMPQEEGWTSFREYQDAFVDVAVADFTRDRTTIYAVPLFVDTLALYYNRDLLNAVGAAEPPETWQEFQEIVEKLTLLDNTGTLVRSGAAIGTARNINRSTDILALLMVQTFGDTPLVDMERGKVNFLSRVLVDGESFTPGIEALRFYTEFANPTRTSYTWNREQDYSIDAFVEGTAAMMINYSHHIATITKRAPQLNLGIARVPQPQALLDQQKPIDYPNYFGLAVARGTDMRKTDAAWRFVRFMSERQPQQDYQQARLRPPARRDLVAPLINDPDLGVFAQQSLTAKSWYQPNNVAVETIIADMIESVIDGATVREALKQANGQVSVLLRRAQ